MQYPKNIKKDKRTITSILLVTDQKKQNRHKIKIKWIDNFISMYLFILTLII